MVVLMLLGVCNFTSGSAVVQAKTEGFILTAEEQNVQPQEQIKANKDTFEKAKSLMAEKNYNAAIEYLTAYISGKPKRYEAYKLRGECYYAMRQYDLAQNDFQTAVDIKKNDDKFATGAKVVGALVLGADKDDQRQNVELGNLYGQLMYAQKALNDNAYEDTYKKAFEYNSHIYLPQPKKEEVAKINCPQKYGKLLNPEGIDVDIQKVVENIETGNFHEAAYKLPNITASYPEYYYGYYLTGVVMAGLEQEKDAISSFEKALSLNPNDFESMASLGQIYYSEAEKYLSAEFANKSIECFEKAIKQNPNCYIYHFYLGLNNLLLSRNDKAIIEFDKAISIKSNDYNSMYYKLIAQYLKGDDNGVVEGSQKLINRHVSNSNSVLYLKALANYRLGNSDAALADIENIFSNMNDLYNADIKRISAKEKTLPEYLYLLKAQILKTKGEDSSKDFANAYKNPIIRTMTRNINTEIYISPSDFENQLDYIRTAFIYQKIMMQYVGDNYKVCNLGVKDTAKKQNSDAVVSAEEPSSLALALASGELSVSDNSEKASQIKMKQTASPDEILSADNSSLAQMLASQSIPKAQNVEENAKDSNEISPSKVAENKTEFSISYPEDIELPSTADIEKTNETNIEKQQEVAKTEISHQKEEKLQENPASDKTIVSAPVQKQAQDFSIKYDEKSPIASLNNATETTEAMEEDAQDLMAINAFESMDEPVKIVEAKEEIIPVVSTPVASYSKPVEYLSTTETSTSESVKTVAKDVKETSEFKISYDEPSLPVLRKAEQIEENVIPQENISQNVEKTIENIKPQEQVQEDITKLVESHLGGSTQNIAQIVDNIEPAVQKGDEVKEIKKVNEKFANVDLNEFNVQKPVLEYRESDEIIVFEPNSFIERAEERLAKDDFGIKDPTKQITDNFSQIQKQAQEYVNSVVDESNQIVSEVEKPQSVVKEQLENQEEIIAKAEQEPKLIVPEAVISEQNVQNTQKEAKEIALMTTTSTPAIVPAVKSEASSENIVEKTDTAAAKKVSEAQEVLTEFENKNRKAAENVAQDVISSSDNRELWDFLSNDYDESTLTKTKDKKTKKLFKRSKKEAQVASIVQEIPTEETVKSDIFVSSDVEKPKKSWFKRREKTEENVGNFVSDVSNDTEKNTKSLKNIFKRAKIEKAEVADNSIEKVKRSWFKRNNDEVDTANSSIHKEKKQINWFWKKGKNAADNTNDVVNKKEKKNFKLFRKNKGE